MTTDAQKRAVKKWREKNSDGIHKVSVDIHDSKDPLLWEWLISQPDGKGTVIRRLMREEIERTGWKPE